MNSTIEYVDLVGHKIGSTKGLGVVVDIEKTGSANRFVGGRAVVDMEFVNKDCVGMVDVIVE
jgi:hypothetical protein